MSAPLPEVRFELVEFNRRRLMRGAEAVRMHVSIDGDEGLIWMSPRDVDRNVVQFGEHPELMRAREAYRRGTLPERIAAQEVPNA